MMAESGYDEADAILSSSSFDAMVGVRVWLGVEVPARGRGRPCGSESRNKKTTTR